jgi:hypothetical protein
MSFYKLLIIPIILLSCTTKQRESRQIAKRDLIQTQAMNTNRRTSDSLAAGDSILIPSFEVEIVLSEKAKERMSDLKESIIVMVEFSGEPKDSNNEGLNEEGQLMLRSIEKEINPPWIAKIENILISKKDYARLKNKDFDVLVQIWTGRKTSEFNLLHGELIDGPISKLKGKRNILSAKLIEE